MIIYFADRYFNILGHASTGLPGGLTITDDLKTADTESGVAVFSCELHFDNKTQLKAQSCAEVGNYLLRNNKGKQEFYTILEAEIDTDKQTVYIYAEDAGMDLINEIVGEYEADREYPISHYINKWVTDAGFEIGINEASDLYRKLKFDAEETVTARIANVAKQFDGCEISFSFDIESLTVTKKYINIYKKRGSDTGVQLRLNKEIKSIVTSKSISNLATALQCEGGTPDDKEEPITLMGYAYDDGDFYVDGTVLKSRKALERWDRFYNLNGSATQSGGHITKPFSSNALTQAELCNEAIAELKIKRDIEVNYEADITKFPDNVHIGDRVNIIDDNGELYLSTRLLKIEESVADQKHKATLGEYLIKGSGISQKVKDLAAQFAKSTISVKRAAQIANNAKEIAETAKKQAETAAEEAETAQNVAGEATAAADEAKQSATQAAAQAQAAQAAVSKVEESVSALDKTVTNAQNAADSAHDAANTAQSKAEEAAQAAQKAQEDANTANETAGNAKTAAENAIQKAEQAQNSAAASITESQKATETAIAAKLDAEEAIKDVNSLGDTLETVKDTMQTEYARKTELTETTATLQTQITKNAAELQANAYKIMTVDETANNAATILETALKIAALAQTQADEASAAAQTAQAEADEALAAANNAQAEADTARAAYELAKGVSEQAEADLLAAKKDLATVEARADATEAEIATARAALEAAEIAAVSAKQNADNAAALAEKAQQTAITAVLQADKAQVAANDAVNKAELAQANADEAKGNAESARATADEALAIAEEAQATANTAKANADSSQATADTARANAEAAQATADAATETLQQAELDLNTAEEQLKNILAAVGSTEEEVEAAQAAVLTAQAAVETARQNAEAAQTAADAARADADTAQAAADEANSAADNAQAAAEAAQRAADEAQGVVNSLVKRTIESAAQIKQNADEIELRATKKEMTDTAEVLATSIIQQVSDMIRMSITDGNNQSLMVQTKDGWTFSTASLQNSVNNTAANLNELTNTVGDINSTVNYLDAAVKELGTLGESVKIGTYTYIDENGETQTEPCIDLYEGDTNFRLKITNTRMAFTDSADTLVYIDSKDKSLNAQKVVTAEIQMNGWQWKTRNNGRNLGLIWKGAAN